MISKAHQIDYMPVATICAKELASACKEWALQAKSRLCNFDVYNSELDIAAGRKIVRVTYLDLDNNSRRRCTIGHCMVPEHRTG